MITYIFGYPVYIGDVEDNEIIYQDVKNYGELKESIEWNAECLTSAVDGHGHDNVSHFSSRVLEAQILKHANSMTKILDLNLELILGTCNCCKSEDYWINSYKKGHKQDIHWHPNVEGATDLLFSFVYFSKYDPDKDAKLVFVNPASPIPCEELKKLPCFQDEIIPDIKEGQLIIFPNIMLHYVQEQNSEGIRTTIAGNLYEQLKE
jgi:hypothetical protein